DETRAPKTEVRPRDSLHWLGSYPLSHARREHSQLVAVLGDGAPRNLNAALFQDVDDRLIGERMLRVLLRHELLDLRLDAARRDVFAGGRREAGREEELERQHPARCLDELLVRHAADGRLVHVDHFGDFAEGERLQVLHPLLEEVALPVDDVVHDLEHRLTPLLDRLDHPVRRIQLAGDELLVLTLELLLVPGDLLIRAAQLEARQVRVVQEDVIAAVDLLDDQVRDDVVVAGARVDESRLGVELLDLVGRLLHVDRADAEALGDLAPAVIDQLLEAVAHETERHRLLEPRLLELKHEALAQIARTDAGRVEALDDDEHLIELGVRVQRQVVDVALDRFGGRCDRVVDRGEQLDGRTGEVAVLVDVANEFVSEERLAGREIEEGDLIEQMVREIARVDRDRLVVLALLVLLAATSGVESVEENLLPVDLVVGLLFFRLLRVGFNRFFL